MMTLHQVNAWPTCIKFVNIAKTKNKASAKGFEPSTYSSANCRSIQAELRTQMMTQPGFEPGSLEGFRPSQHGR